VPYDSTETTPPYAPRSSRFGSEPPSVEDDVDVWCYAILELHARNDNDTTPQASIRYDSVHLLCSKNLTGSQLSLPRGTNKKLKCETNNKMVSVIGLVQSHYHEGSPVGKRSLRWEGFVEKIGFIMIHIYFGI